MSNKVFNFFIFIFSHLYVYLQSYRSYENQYIVCYSNLIKKLEENKVCDEELKKLIDELLQEKE
ncbi:hypothetical protein [Terrisporobacter petrolearius]|uniref:hypothetical protein n=1 Tax=Terrisporobacter petrolearius TaxID=1460447 RepID=UPI003AFFF83D